MKNILVTGGAGFIGSNFIRHLLQAEADLQIINLDALTYAGSLENLKDLPDPARHIFVKGDICDNPLVTGLLRQYEIDTLVHFAAESHVDRSILGPLPFVQTNLVGTFTLLEAVRQVWSERGDLADHRFHHVSTDEVFGSLSSDSPAFTEKTPYDPRSPYSASKAGSDHLVRAYFLTYGLPVTISNCSNNYGPYQFPEKLIPLMALNALQGKPLPVYGDGQQIRDWLYVEDHCEAIQLILTNGKTGETYNIGGGNQPANIEIIRQICSLMDELHPEGSPHDRLITQVPDRPGHDRRYAMDISKIQSKLGWAPKYNLMTGLRSTVKWFLNHPKWVEAIAQQSGYNDWVDRNYVQRGNKL
jgi:dTDP-glucose 4,6-dehydratase